jgi:hypothetical protein
MKRVCPLFYQSILSPYAKNKEGKAIAETGRGGP